ncbi:MAG: A/G-specific adenine glycosylase [Vicingaceae bacterium]|nr:MAG: A/G-specific adenine glycosylase [Vicingaceae bacterium]
MEISSKIIEWFEQNKRDLPWRQTKDPYKIWISEIILQQTRVNQGLGYYLRFLERFPDLQSLATSDRDDVMKMWEGLGYYSRAKNLHEGAKQIYFDRNGQWPGNFHEWLKIKGVGRYTAAAISSLCYGEKVPVVDGNVYRVISRIFGVADDISSNAAYKRYFLLAYQFMGNQNSASFNEAMMELGAMVCLPSQPVCIKCPVTRYCFAYTFNAYKVLPFSKKKNKPVIEEIYYALIERDKKIALVKRDDSSIWKGLWELPRISGEIANNAYILSKTTHLLTHKKLNIGFYKLMVEDLPKNIENSLVWKNKSGLKKLAFPKPVKEFLTQYLL